jgi:hypothetical protein
MISLHSLPDDLRLVKESVYDVCGLKLNTIQLHKESLEYSACSFELNKNNIEYRCSKITPTKTGQFVTIWKRNAEGITAPFDISDGIDFIIITARSGDHLGQFIFPTAVLAEKGIVSRNGKSGKRGIRVYPPWDSPASKQALATQQWQLHFFLQISHTESITEIQKLLGGN